MSDAQDLVERLADTARDAVLARCTAIEAGGAGELNGVTVEITLSNHGQVLDVESYLGWRSVIRQAMRGSR